MSEEAKSRVLPGSVSVIVPTLNEAGNIDLLLDGILACARGSTPGLEVIVVDDGSTDGTRELVRNWGRSHPVRLLARDQERGLAGAVLAGAAAASGEVVVVMDADLSHPPDKIGELVRPILEGTSDLVIGSRYVSGGSTPGWPLSRRLASRAAAALAWPLVEVRDPLSGFFAVGRERLLEAGRQAVGFKIGLEVLLRGGDGLRVQEVPIRFQDRAAGTSKLGFGVVRGYLLQLARLAGGAVSTGTAARFALVGLLGVVIDLLVFNLLLSAGVQVGPAHLGSFLAATVANYLLNSRWAFAESWRGARESIWRGYLSFAAVALLAVFLRGGILALLSKKAGWSPTAAILPAILAAAVVNYLGSAFYVFSRTSGAESADRRWRVAAMGILAYGLVLRLVYLGQVDLLPEEAYYWNYSQHLAPSYLDHPPMVAWLIAAGTRFFGHNEFAVRIGAVAAWLVSVFFTYALARNLLGKAAGIRTVLLLGVLPFFFGVGYFMTPDAPLVAFWAGTLYFLERALLGERRWAWAGAGICLGFGLLSKYPIALLALAALAYLLLDRRSRRWLLRPEPYAAGLLAALLFSPVIYWNAQHGWASFLFQGPQRWHHAPHFNLPLLLGSVLLLVTPLAPLGFLLGLFGKRRGEPPPGALEPVRGSQRRFLLVFTLAPLAVFAFASLRHETKLQWTGPVWLAALPAVALTFGSRVRRRRLEIATERIWKPAILTLLLAYGAGFHLAVLGLPGVKLPPSYYTMNWRDLGRQVEDLNSEVVALTEEEPLIVGMDKYHISSEVAFYDPDFDGPWETAGIHLFGRRSLMYEYWFPPELQEGKSLVLVSEDPKALNSDAVRERVERLEPIRELPVTRDGVLVGRYYARIAHGYRSVPAPQPAQAAK